MNDVQVKLAELIALDWSQAAVADELGVSKDTVQRWRAGRTYPPMPKPILIVMESLKKKRPPKRKRYDGTHHLQRKQADAQKPHLNTE